MNFNTFDKVFISYKEQQHIIGIVETAFLCVPQCRAEEQLSATDSNMCRIAPKTQH